MVAGERLKDRYLVSRQPLAHRGMAEVWPARDLLLDRDVVVKLLVTATMDVELVRRFRREARLTARLDHPGVPAIHDLGEHRGRPYVVLQKIDGVTLSDLIAEQGPLPVSRVAAIGAQVSAVLLAAEQIGLVHRDIKPSNIMLEATGAVKVLDFGLAVVRDDERYSRITQTGQTLGTVGYMAPEQVLGEPTDHRSDLYGLGATLFDLLTAQPPFDGGTVSVFQRQAGDSPPRPSHLRPDVPRTVDDLIHALLAVRPQDRPDSAAAVYAVLAPLAQDPPPIPGVVTDAANAVRGYAAIVGQLPVPAGRAVPPQPGAGLPELGMEQAEEQAERLAAAGEYRAVARLWRRIASELARRRGDDDPAVFECRLRCARAHLPLGETDRALYQLRTLLRDQVRAHGPEHAAVLDLQQEIERLSERRPATEGPAGPRWSRPGPNQGR